MYSSIFKTIAVPGSIMHRDPKTLKKLVDGRPFKPLDWTISKKDTPLMLADTGHSNIVAVDFDGTEGDINFNTALSIDPDCQYIAKGIGKGGGHMIYRSSGLTLLRQTIESENGCKIGGLDLQMGRKLIMLATKANETKQLLTPELENYEQLTEMPLGMQAFISSIYLGKKQTDKIETTGMNRDAHTDSKLYYVVKTAIDTPDQYNHKLFNIITTRHYKAIMLTSSKHPEYPYVPDNLPSEESGNAYMVSIATILGKDPSIDDGLFLRTLHYINNLFSDPMPVTAIEQIATYITSGQSKIGGTQVWQYNPEWQKAGMIYVDNDGSSHEVFTYVDKGTNHFLDHCHVDNRLTTLHSMNALIDQIKMTSTVKLNKDKVISRIKAVRLISTPMHPIGVIRKDFGSDFNTYNRTEEQEIFMEPSTYNDYTYPDTTIRFLENSMGKERTHGFFLPFWKRKLSTRDFSPLVLTLYGPPHSGKSAVSEGILKPLTKGRSQQLSPEILTEKYDDWKLNKDLIFVDEIHNMRSDLQQKVIGSINTISGVSTFTGIRAMQSSASAEEHPNTITVMVALNKPVGLITEKQDRRIVILRSHSTASKALDMGNAEIFAAITQESKDFAYYLSTEVQALAKDKYLDNNWLKDEDYREFMNGTLPFIKRLALAIDKMEFDTLEDMVNEFGLSMQDIAHASSIIKKQVHIRLLNTNENEALIPALFVDTHLNAKDLNHELGDINNVRVKSLDTAPGKRTINRKTVAMFNEESVPEELLAMINHDTITPI